MANTLIISATSDIGYAYAQSCRNNNHTVLGTCRDVSRLSELDKVCDIVLSVDLSDECSIEQFKENYIRTQFNWSRLVFCPCQPFPYKNFFTSSFHEWVQSFELNSLRQLQLLHFLYDFRSNESKVLFFAGGGTNSSVESFSAYTSAKIHLIKMVELLDCENPDITFSILGPGWVNTKTHLNVFKYASHDSKKFNETTNFIANPQGATPMINVMKSIQWIFEQPKSIVGGRNFSSAYDPIELHDPDSTKLVSYLSKDANMYKLRRYGNHYFNRKRFS
jgi:short-subunit dehydrogenase